MSRKHTKLEDQAGGVEANASNLLGGGRVNQKWRTRNAIVCAAAELVAEGKHPSIAKAADAARVSHATAYRYFSSGEELLLEAAGEASFLLDIEQVSARIGDSPEVGERIDRLVEAFQALVREHESTVRTQLQLALARSTNEAIRVRSMYRYRPGWLEQAVEPLRGQMSDEALQRLMLALSLCMGTEAHIVLRDLHELSAERADEVCHWAANAVLAAALRDAEPAAAAKNVS